METGPVSGEEESAPDSAGDASPALRLQRRLAWILALTVAVPFVAALAFLMTGLCTMRIRDATSGAMASRLHMIYEAQASFRGTCLTDVDGDGVGEYATLEDLVSVGDAEVKRGFAVRLRPWMNSMGGGILPARDDVVRFEDFLIRIHRPAGEAGETRWCAYAWLTEESRGRGLVGVYCIDQTGELTEAEDREGIHSGVVGPPVGAAFLATDPSVRAVGVAGGDGLIWKRY